MTLTVIPWRSVERHDDQDHQIGHGQADVDDAAQDAVDPAAIIGRDEGERRADRRRREFRRSGRCAASARCRVVMTANRLRPWRSLPKGSAQDGGCSTRAESGRAFCGSTSSPPITAKAIMPNSKREPDAPATCCGAR